MTGRRSAALAAYLGVSRLAGPLAPFLLRRRLLRGREDPLRVGERLGWPGRERPEGPLVWLHAASIGEAMSLLPLVSALLEGPHPPVCLVTTGTVTAAARMADLLPEGALHQFAPVDTASAVRGFLDHWRPDLAIWVESEFWPRLMWETGARRGIPMMLVNARISARSARGWTRLPAMAARLLGLFRAIVTQDAASAERLAALGADPARIREGGNLKTLLPPPAADPEMLATLQAGLEGRPLWLAASTHAPEEEAVIAAHAQLAAAHAPLLTMLAPRHPERAEAIAAAARAAGLTVARRSAGQGAPAEAGLWLLDTLGEMGLWYRLAPVAFVGGSLARVGGHNPFEPVALGAAVLHGPSTENFAPAYAALAAGGGAIEVADAESLATALDRLLPPAPGAAEARAAMLEAAGAALARERPDLDALVAEARALLDEGPRR
ncbi:MAG: glycosyltransferase N-terminal domain-containing protein [Pseudomonadota bacterium]